MAQKVLASFSGPFGDILWSLPTVKEIAKTYGPVDFGIMPEYKSLLPLLQLQSYIARAFVIEDWKCEGSPHGNQPWQPPVRIEKGYEKCFHLTYRAHPGIGGKRLALIDFIADQQGITLPENPLPFIETLGLARNEGLLSEYVALVFNDLYKDKKSRFVEVLRKAKLSVLIIDVSGEPWLQTAILIGAAVGFVGCRSANYVIANGVGQKNIFTYEPHPSRNAHGQFGDVFGCPYGKEVTNYLESTPEIVAERCLEEIRNWITVKSVGQISQEKSNATLSLA